MLSVDAMFTRLQSEKREVKEALEILEALWYLPVEGTLD